MHPTAITCTAILGILLFGLGPSVSMLRFREKRLAGLAPCATLLRSV